MGRFVLGPGAGGLLVDAAEGAEEEMTHPDRQRKIDALRRLAERPGTPAEGEVARAMLARVEAASVAGDDIDGLIAGMIQDVGESLPEAYRRMAFGEGAREKAARTFAEALRRMRGEMGVRPRNAPML